MNSKNAPKDVAADTKTVVTDGPSIASATADDVYTVVARMQVRLEVLEARATGELPMGVSEWINHGKKYGYWDYALAKERKQENTHE
jgi:hypothetical protein